MAEIINLRRARKRRQRRDAEALAASNRGKYGRSKAERDASSAEHDRREAELDGKRLPTEPEAD